MARLVGIAARLLPVLVLVIVLLALGDEAAAFVPVPRHYVCIDVQHGITTPHSSVSLPLQSFPLHATRRVDDENDSIQGDDDDDDRLRAEIDARWNENNRPSRQGRSMAGGRARKPSSSPAKKTMTWNNWFVRAGLPLLVAAFFLKSLFGGESAPSTSVNSSPSYFYYQSSYYESRVYTGDGNMERTYRRSVQSNVPSLLEGQQRRVAATESTSSQGQQQREDLSTQIQPTMRSTYLLRESPDRGLDQELDAALIKVQQAMFADWY